MSLDDVVQLTITATSRTPTQAGFGTALIAAYHEHWTDVRVREYASASDMLDDGFLVTEPAYLAAVALKSQNPAPPTFKIGRRAVVHATTLDHTTFNATGNVLGVVIDGKVVVHVVTSGENGDDALVAAGLLAAANAALSGYINSSDGDVITVIAPGGLVPTTASVLTAALDPTSHTATGNVLSCTVDGHAVSYTVALSANGSISLVCAGLAAAAVAALPAGYKVFTNGLVVYVTRSTGIAPTTASLVFLTSTPTTISDLVVTPVSLGPPKQTVNLIPTNLSSGFTYAGIIGGKPFTYTIAGGDAGNLTSVCTAFATVISALGLAASVTPSSSNVQVEVTTAGTFLDFAASNKASAKALHFKDVTTDTALAGDLAAIRDEDDDWYCLLLDTNNQATILEAAAVIETLRKICVVQSADWDVRDNAQSGDVGSLLKASSYARTGLWFHDKIGGTSWLAAGVAGGRLPVKPGKETWAFKGVAGVPVVALKDAEETALANKNVSKFSLLGGLPTTFEGKTGSGEFMDTIRGVDCLYARIQERMIFLLNANPKIPYTDSGVDIIRGGVLAVLDDFVKDGLLAATPAPTFNAPKVADVDPTLRANRILPDCTFGAQLAGAVHRLRIDGTISL